MTRRARDVLIDILRDEGITHVFGNPGSTETPLMDALVNAPDAPVITTTQPPIRAPHFSENDIESLIADMMPIKTRHWAIQDEDA
jgi:Thiamine pyrophosphate enzyme, N-terminal TPP binding domain